MGWLSEQVADECGEDEGGAVGERHGEGDLHFLKSEEEEGRRAEVQNDGPVPLRAKRNGSREQLMTVWADALRFGMTGQYL